MGTPLLIGCWDQCSWMFVWVYICIVVGLFLVSVFSSFCFYVFFFLIWEGLLFLSQHGGEGEPGGAEGVPGGLSGTSGGSW